MAESESLRALLSGLIDYAGLFPPAGLGMREAVVEYAAARRGPQAWMLGRFVLPAARLEEFARTRAAIKRGAGGVWRLNALVGNEGEDLAAVRTFQDAHANQGEIEAVECKGATPAEIAARGRALPSEFERYCEIPLGGELERCLTALKAAGLRAKVRTGGLTPEAIPSPAALARLLAACAAAAVPFKATAGLHHPLRGLHALGGARAQQRATMHGFVNVFLAAACARQGWGAARLEPLLRAERAGDFRFDAGGVVWLGERIARDEIVLARRAFALGFGSCSWAEPVGDLQALGWL